MRSNYKIGDIVHPVDIRNEGIEIGHVIKIDDIDFVCYSRMLELVKDQETDLVINTAIAGDKEIKDRFSRFVSVLVWEKRIEEG